MEAGNDAFYCIVFNIKKTPNFLHSSTEKNIRGVVLNHFSMDHKFSPTIHPELPQKVKFKRKS